MLKPDPSTKSVHVIVPDEALPVLGKQVEGTRMYEQWGSGEDLMHYFNFITDTYGGTVSPGGAAETVGVTRAAVHNRMKAGKLTAFLFYTSMEKHSARSLPYVHIPMIELMEWRKEIVERTESRMEALSIKRKDWDDSFMAKRVRVAQEELKKRGIKVYKNHPLEGVFDE